MRNGTAVPQGEPGGSLETLWQHAGLETATSVAVSFYGVLMVLAGLFLLLWWEYRSVTKATWEDS